MSIASILNIAKNAVSLNQTSIQVTSHNISNVNTKGYSRQEVVITEETPMLIGNVLIGNGAKVSGIIRYHDKYLDQQIAKKSTEFGEHQIYKRYFERVESVLNEDSTKLTENITAFFNAWQELSTDPQNVAMRGGLKSSAQQMTRSINNIYNELKGLQIELNNNVKMEVADINRITASIADLNNKVFQGSSSSSEANDYLDRRTQYVKELSSKIGIISFEDEYGRMTIMTSKGKSLVDGGQSWELGVKTNQDTGFYRVGWEDFSGNFIDITDDINSGGIYGLLEMRDNQINDFIADTDKLAEVIISEVNSLHKNGYTQNHNVLDPNPDGIPFFRELTGLYAKDIDISDKIKLDLKNIASSSEVDITGKPIGNGIAIDIAALMEKGLFDGNTSTFVDYTSTLTNKIGQLTKGAKDFAQYSEDTMNLMEKQREGISGVSLDEEMADLIKYQYAFQAASRLFTVADELFQTLLGAFK
ncbi:MAG TPA: flagellar hook-associated protein FlgK [Syntrophorhabdaceae bacterium]|jgi:flagellar hook-associated protein 1 FlgK|nr:flagellar hook-associated protein FlgK [Syntrophorhabdaceae bacterium]HNQ63733.1 flagellar hook-associated protein FlgK [Syntrophorhabdaceae bacterium]HOF58617.1 flagellar hook-associated protein FlgK [Syntrophorhabdaceae bacterium]HOG39614.1 flagellar hook-associated protein FlgK [Syntrophorhabdaceae bacterium]HPL41422.1 flagellar hook-associated protein FlgK [Syntrophorhabdaceae bacterium]